MTDIDVQLYLEIVLFLSHYFSFFLFFYSVFLFIYRLVVYTTTIMLRYGE